MQTVQKQALPVVISDKGEPVALIYFTQSRDRIIYTMQPATEEELITLLTQSLTVEKNA